MPQGLVEIPSDPQQMAEIALTRLSIPLLSLNFSYLVILAYCLKAFFCYDFMGTTYSECVAHPSDAREYADSVCSVCVRFPTHVRRPACIALTHWAQGD